MRKYLRSGRQIKKSKAAVLSDQEFESNIMVNTVPKYVSLNELSPRSYKGLSFLIAEDDIDQLELMGSFIIKHGGDVVYATNGQITVELYTGNPEKYNIIITDIQMPVMDGEEATRQIRASGAKSAKTIPIIAVSGNALISKNASLFTYYLTKPYKWEKLAAIIDHCKLEN